MTEFVPCTPVFVVSAGGEPCSVSLIKVENGIIQTDPDYPNSPHNCGVATEDSSESKVCSVSFNFSFAHKYKLYIGLDETVHVRETH